jgi:hypothetical protein
VYGRIVVRPRPCRNRTRLCLALLALTALLLALPAAASAGEKTKRDKGGVSKRVAKRFHLTRAERKAMDVSSVKVYAQEGLGVFVRVTFRGNIEKALGRRHLKRAAVAMVLRPKSKRLRKTVVVTTGRGATRRLLTRSRTKNVGAVRDRRTITFFVQGAGASNVKSVVVKAFVRDPRLIKRRARSSVRLDADDANEFDGDEGEGDEEVVVIDISELTTEQLRELIEAIVDAGNDLGDERDGIEDDLDDIDRDLNKPDLSARSKRALRREKRDLEDALDEIKREQAALFVFYVVVTNELNQRQPGAVQEVLKAVMRWVFINSMEVGDDSARFEATGRLGGYGPHLADVRSPITAIRVVVPPSGNTPRQITNKLCPTQLPTAQITTTTNTNDTLVCSGGSLPVGTNFRVHVQTNPLPTAGMGGQLFGQQDGAFKGPFDIAGP